MQVYAAALKLIHPQLYTGLFLCFHNHSTGTGRPKFPFITSETNPRNNESSIASFMKKEGKKNIVKNSLCSEDDGDGDDDDQTPPQNV